MRFANCWLGVNDSGKLVKQASLVDAALHYDLAI